MLRPSRLPSGACVRPGVVSAMSSSLAEHSQNLIQQEWIRAGKPHNFICSTCRKPGNLVYCATCCRSYHLACLSAPPAPEDLANWSCPSCRERQSAAGARPSPSRVPSSDVSVASPMAPGANPASMGPNATLDSGSPMATSSTPSSGSLTAKSPQTQCLSAVDESFERERKFLVDYGDFPPNQEFKRDLLVQMRRLIQGVELHAQTRRELELLRSENARLRKENTQLKMNAKSRRAPHGPIYGGLRRSPSASSRADTSLDSIEALKPPDVSEKSWDRIISDAF